MVKIAFWDNCLSERGTTVAMYNYAYYNQTILGNESVIMYNITRKETDPSVVEMFKKHFEVISVHAFSQVDPILIDKHVDIFYITKAGEWEGQISQVRKTVVHCVFNYSQPHGNVYAGISNWIGGNHRNHPIVPYIVDLPENDSNMRAELGIPEDATVFGRHGGEGQFDIQYAQQTVYNIAKTCAERGANIYFLFMNTTVFCPSLPNIIHIGRIVDLHKKVAFINTCDAMLWARSGGETFGLAIAEFSIKNKPVFATKVGDVAHIHLLGDKAVWYDESNLHDLIVNFDKTAAASKDWNAYRDYSPENVMQTFKRVFIDN